MNSCQGGNQKYNESHQYGALLTGLFRRKGPAHCSLYTVAHRKCSATQETTLLTITKSSELSPIAEGKRTPLQQLCRVVHENTHRECVQIPRLQQRACLLALLACPVFCPAFKCLCTSLQPYANWCKSLESSLCHAWPVFSACTVSRHVVLEPAPVKQM